DGLARGYLNRPDLTAEKFVPDPLSAGPGARLYRTGDLARYLPDGSIEFLGRKDHQVKLRGFRIELGEIESVLARHPGVRDAVVMVREDHPGEKRLVAYVTGRDGQTVQVGALRDHVKRRLPGYMVPSAFVTLEKLPLSPNGKVDRRALSAPEPADQLSAEGFVAPRTPAEAQLAELWAAVLRVDRVGVHDNFFELGGDSIISIQIVPRAAQSGIRFPPRQLFQHQTVAELAAVAGSE